MGFAQLKFSIYITNGQLVTEDECDSEVILKGCEYQLWNVCHGRRVYCLYLHPLRLTPTHSYQGAYEHREGASNWRTL